MKKNVKNIILSVLCVAALGGLSSVIIKNVNKPSNEPSISVPSIPDEPEVDTRENLAVVDFTKLEAQTVSNDNAKEFLNSCSTKAIFGDPLPASMMPSVYGVTVLPNFGLKVTSNLNMSLNDFTYNRIKVKAINIYTKSETPESDGRYTYTGSQGYVSLDIDGRSESLNLPVNEDKYTPYSPVEKTFELSKSNSQLKLAGGLSGCVLLSLELWTE